MKTYHLRLPMLLPLSALMQSALAADFSGANLTVPVSRTWICVDPISAVPIWQTQILVGATSPAPTSPNSSWTALVAPEQDCRLA